LSLIYESSFPLLEYFYSLEDQIETKRENKIKPHMVAHRRIKSSNPNWTPVAQTYNPSYSEGRDQEDYSSKPDWGNSS
jgi:hypothetical protein